MNANESFEKAAKAFEKATGKLMPGKDVGSAWPGEEWEEERQREFKIWCAAVDYMRAEKTESQIIREIITESNCRREHGGKWEDFEKWLQFKLRAMGE